MFIIKNIITLPSLLLLCCCCYQVYYVFVIITVIIYHLQYGLLIPKVLISLLQVGDLQQRRCGVVFDLSCSLARLLEFCTREIPQVFLLGPDMNLRRLIELIIFILNHIISASDAEFFDM